MPKQESPPFLASVLRLRYWQLALAQLGVLL